MWGLSWGCDVVIICRLRFLKLFLCERKFIVLWWLNVLCLYLLIVLMMSMIGMFFVMLFVEIGCLISIFYWFCKVFFWILRFRCRVFVMRGLNIGKVESWWVIVRMSLLVFEWLFVFFWKKKFLIVKLVFVSFLVIVIVIVDFLVLVILII